MMRYLIKIFIALVFIMPLNVSADGIMENFQSDKIKLNIDFFDSDNDLPGRLLEKRNSGRKVSQHSSTIYRVTVDPGFDNVKMLLMLDMNIARDRYECESKNQRWKSSNIFHVWFENSLTGKFYTYIPEPCILVGKEGKALIKLEVSVATKNTYYYKTFVYGNK